MTDIFDKPPHPPPLDTPSTLDDLFSNDPTFEKDIFLSSQGRKKERC